MIYGSKAIRLRGQTQLSGEPMTLICTRPLSMRGTIGGGLLEKTWNLEVGKVYHMERRLMKFFLEKM